MSLNILEGPGKSLILLEVSLNVLEFHSDRHHKNLKPLICVSINFKYKSSGNFRLLRAVSITDALFPENFRLKQTTFYLSASTGPDGVLPPVLSVVVLVV